jgi:hypothetical protein
MERFSKPVIFLMLVNLIIGLKSKNLVKFAPALTAILLIIIFFNSKSSAEKHYKIAGIPKDWESGFNWLNKNTDKGDKVLTLSPLISNLIAIHTHNKQQIGDGHPVICSVSQDQASERTAVLFKTLGLSKDDFLFYYPSRYGNLNHGLYYRDEFDPFLYGLDGYVHVTYNWGTTNEDSPFKKDILNYYDKVLPLKDKFYIWVNTGEKISPNFKKVYSNKSIDILESKGQ